MKLHPAIQSVLASVIIASLTSCASIVSGGPKVVRINSNPEGAKVSIFDKTGAPVSVNTTPTVVSLKRAHGAYQGEDYKIVIEKQGYQPVETHIKSTVNGWYLGNIVFGGLIGILIVDPITGAMFTLSPTEINQQLEPVGTTHLTAAEQPALRVMLTEQTTPAQRTRMVPLTAQR